jgi:hypothetical protein
MGFERFLLPKELNQLINVVGDGPLVIVNVHRSRCDALILKHGQSTVDHVHLAQCTVESISSLRGKLQSLLKNSGRYRRKPYLHQESNVSNQETVFGEVLHDLWVAVVKPVLEALDFFVSVFATLAHVLLILDLTLFRVPIN